MARDMTKKQFDEACEKHGFKREGFLGYYKVTDTLSASILNAGPRRRDQLAYLINARDKQNRKKEGGN